MSLNAIKGSKGHGNAIIHRAERRIAVKESICLGQFSGVNAEFARRCIEAAQGLDLSDVPVKTYSQEELDQDAAWEQEERMTAQEMADEDRWDELNGYGSINDLWWMHQSDEKVAVERNADLTLQEIAEFEKSVYAPIDWSFLEEVE